MSCLPTVKTKPPSDVDGEATTSRSTTIREQHPPNIKDIMVDDQHESSERLSSATDLRGSPTKCNGNSSEFNTTTMMTSTTGKHLLLDQEETTVDATEPQHCDKNKQHAGATFIPMAQDQQSVGPAGQPPSITAKQSSSSYSTTSSAATTKLTDPGEMNQTDASSETPSGHTEFRVPMAKSSKVEEEGSSPQINRRAAQRRASVFSHDGFLDINQLDQSAIKQHSSLQDLTKGSQQEMQVMTSNNNNGTNKIEDLNTKLAGPTAAPAPSSSSSPQRPTRSDTLGSTGSSRASSCDEPTIVSNLSSKNGSQQIVEDAGQLNNTGSSSSTDGSLDSINNASSMEDDLKPETNHLTSPLRTMKTKNDDDVFSSTSMAPAFQSIKSQLKRNSVPDAKFITQHIEKLISQNEAIIENWDQVSIRSYNSQANTTQSSACTPTPATTTTTTNPTTQQQISKRPSKRWSTTSLQTTCGPAESFKAAADHLVEARLRRRSQNTMKRPSIRPNLPHGASALLSPNFVNNGPTSAPNSQFFAASKDDHQYQHPAQFLFGPPSATSSANTTAGLSSSVPSSPRLCASSSAFLEIQKFLNGRLNIDASDTTVNVEPMAECSTGTQMSDPIQFNQNIENAIKNLSLKRNEEERQRALIQERLQLAANQHQQNLLMQATQQPDDLLMASMLGHYNLGHTQHQQQQQIFKEQHVNPSTTESEIAAAILSHYQQRQALEQLNMSRLAEYQQQQLLTAAALHRQQQIQQQHQSAELDGRGGPALERQPRDSQVLNEFLARMMLGRDVQPSKAPTDAQIHSQQPHPIVMHDNQQQQASEMFTQPLDSATPAHRCNDCDIPFWTRDLLNYHLMTSCSARTGPQPNRPIAFNFGQPNGFDKAPNLSATNPSLLMPPSAAQLATETALSLMSGSASPPKWRTSYNGRFEDHAPSQVAAAVAAATGNGRLDCVTLEEPQKRLSYAGNVLVAPKSPHKSRESAELAWQQRLSELCILKQQLIEANNTSALKPQTAFSSSTTTNDSQESNLPIKKRKISEPNMRY